MNQQDLRQQILAACSDNPRDFTIEEMAYILSDESLKNELRMWFDSTASDGCWTEQTVNFMNTL